MATYSVVIQEQAEAEFLAIPFPFRRQLKQLIFKLMNDPRPKASELVDEGSHRLRFSGWVMLYEVDDERALITITAFRQDPPWT